MRALTASLVASALALASGCSSSPSKSDAAGSPTSTSGPGAGGGVIASSAVSGMRLRASSIVGGGAREVSGFHDTMRNEDCTFQPAEEGHIRCLPPTVTVQGQTGLFSDPACKIPSASTPAPTGCAVGVKYGVLVTYANCGTPQAQELHQLRDPGAPTYYAGGPTGTGTCTLSPAPPPGRPATVSLGDVVSWSSFVEGVETVVPGDPVSEKVLVATDGARQHVGYRDEKRNVDCSFQLMADGVTRCVPKASEGQIMYGDSACTKPLAVNDYRNTGGCGATGGMTAADNFWLEPSAHTCGGLRNVYQLATYDGTVAGVSIFNLTNQDPSGRSSSGPSLPECQSSGTLSSGSSFRTISAAVSTSLPTVSRVGGGTDRLVPALVWPPGAETLAAGWHDTMTDVDCTFALATDGKMRCLPTAATATILFTDGACTSTERVAVLSEPSCIGLRRYAREVSTTCPPTTRIYAVGADARDLTNASVSAGPGTCGKVSQAMSALDATEVDPSQFVEGVTAVE